MRTILSAARVMHTVLLLAAVAACTSCGERGDRSAPVEEHAEAHHEEDAHVEGDGEASGVLVLAPEAVALAEIATAPAARRALRSGFTATGEIAVNDKRTARVVARTDGWVQAVHRYVGDNVRAGDILAEIASPGYQTAVNDLLLAVKRLERARATADAREMESAGAIVNSARRRLLLYGESKAEIEQLVADASPPATVHVHAPLGGTVLTSNAVPGHAVEPGAELYAIADLATVWALVDVFEKDLARVTVAAPVFLTVAAYPDERFAGKVTLVNSTMDEATRTVKVRVEVPNGNRRLRPGMFVAATISAGPAREGLAVPEAAIQEDGEERYVFVAEGGGRFRRQTVEVGTRDSGYVAVVAGLVAGTEVVTDGAFVLKSELLKSGFEAGHAH